MDSEGNQYEVEKENMGEVLNYVENGMPAELVIYNDKPIAVEIPQTIVREIAYTEPAVKGDTSGKVTKAAKLKTGFVVQVPLFCATGDRIEIDSPSGEYRSRFKG
jgi:elongation factor P